MAVPVLLIATGASDTLRGQSIAQAPAILFGQQQFGNLTNGLATPSGCAGDMYSEFWLLNVLAGDKLTIDWEAQELDYTRMDVYPVGTTDFTYSTVAPAAESRLASNGKAEELLQATRSGAMPVRFRSGISCVAGTPGPYDFTAYVKHKAVLSLGRFSKLSHAGVVAVNAHTPDGTAVANGLTVSVQVNRRGWKSVGSAPVSSGVARVKVHIPASYKGRRLSVRAIAQGNDFQPAASAGRAVRIT